MSFNKIYLGTLASRVSPVAKESACNAGDADSIFGQEDPLE